MMTPEQINTIIATQKKNDENFSAKDISDTEVYNDVLIKLKKGRTLR